MPENKDNNKLNVSLTRIKKPTKCPVCNQMRLMIIRMYIPATKYEKYFCHPCADDVLLKFNMNKELVK